MKINPNDKEQVLRARARIVIRGWAGMTSDERTEEITEAIVVAAKVLEGWLITDSEELALLKVLLDTSMIAEGQGQLIADLD